jgi:N,N-dimethylformamidase beta subunit-like protein
VHGTLPAKIAVVIPQFTWQAYNEYGGSSLYTKDSAGALYHRVSFERPYLRGGGSNHLLENGEGFELKVARWLERLGMDVSYISDLDLATHRALPNGTKVLVFAGHDEYWTWDEFSYVQSLRDAGIHLMILAGNAAYWNVRLEKGTGGQAANTIYCYRASPDPEATTLSETTTRFRDSPLHRPEAALYGISYFEVAEAGARMPLWASDTALGPDATAFLAAAGISAGDSIGGFVGGEGDRPTPGISPSNLEVLFRSPDRTQDPLANHYYYTTFFVAPSGAGVFAGGNNYYARALDDLFDAGDPRIQRLTLAILEWMLAK